MTDRQIRRAAQRGVDNLYELRQALGVGAGCGTCSATAKSILDETNARYAKPRRYEPSPA